MREYELIVVFNLSYAEENGQDAAPKYVEEIIQANNGNLLKMDHWGRRRMAYPIDGMLDADYVLSRVELEPAQVQAMEGTFRINERILRFMTVRADELPTPPPPREEQAPAATTPEAAAPTAAPAAAPAEPATASEPAAPAESPAAPAESPAAPAEAPAPAPTPEATPAPEGEGAESRAE